MKHESTHPTQATAPATLDPTDWTQLRSLGHEMVDALFDDLVSLRSGPTWRAMPEEIRQGFRTPIPNGPEGPSAAWEAFRDTVLPYGTGNRHPRFMGWVHGGGTAIGMLAAMAAAGLNANLGGRDHAPIEVERQVVRWMAGALGLPQSAGGIMVTGTSMATVIAITTAYRRAAGQETRQSGTSSSKYLAYACETAHGCVARAMDLIGLGTDRLRIVPMTKEHRIDIECLQQMMKGDQARGLVPFVAVGTAGTVDAGAVDDLQALATVCKEHEAWFHADAAFGAMLALSPSRRQMIQGIELADSVALDLHKWGQVPYDAGMVIAKDSNALVEAFSTDRAYLAGSQRGIAAGRPWPCDMGPDLSRGGRAIAAWMTMKAYGAAAFGEVVDRSCETAAAMARRITSEPSLELLAPVATNIVCFRVREHPENIDLDALNRWIVEEIQLSGSAVPSTTRIDGKLAIRAAVVNHRTTTADGLVLIDEVLRVAKKRQTARSTA